MTVPKVWQISSSFGKKPSGRLPSLKLKIHKVIIFTMIEEHRFRIFLDQIRFKDQDWTALINAGIVNIMLSSQDQETPVAFEPGEGQRGQRNHRIVQSPSQPPPAFPPGSNCQEHDT